VINLPSPEYIGIIDALMWHPSIKLGGCDIKVKRLALPKSTSKDSCHSYASLQSYKPSKLISSQSQCPKPSMFRWENNNLVLAQHGKSVGLLQNIGETSSSIARTVLDMQLIRVYAANVYLEIHCLLKYEK